MDLQERLYYQAESKIMRALHSDAKELSLSGMQLTKLPESLKKLTQLSELNLSRNKLSILPKWITHLSELKSLNLSKNKISKLPECIGELNQLQSLNLDDNNLASLPQSFQKLTQLNLLELSINQFMTLPELIGELTNLQTLSLSRNNLSRLPLSIAQLTQLEYLNLSGNPFTHFPDSIEQLSKLRMLNLSINMIEVIPKAIEKLTQLRTLFLLNSRINKLPESIGQLIELESLHLSDNKLDAIPESIGQLIKLKSLHLSNNKLDTIPESIGQLKNLIDLQLDNNPLAPEMKFAYDQGFDAIKIYLRAKLNSQLVLNEAKLILVGEGEVGKTCLMDALADAHWQKHDSTHGIEIRSIQLTDTQTHTTITLNGWDFGGQRIYRPTHQLFFSSPAVYLVVWKPREGKQQGFVEDWIKLIKHREPEAKILVVATHGGPKTRQPDIDRQTLQDTFGSETVVDFFHVDSKPDDSGQRSGISQLKEAILRVAIALPEMGRTVPESFAHARNALKETKVAYLSLENIHYICRKHGMDQALAELFIRISHRLGHFIHYEHDSILRNIVILKPDWLAKAISFVLDDAETRQKNGLVSFVQLNQLWNDPAREEADRYPSKIHKIFLRLMERFDLSYRVAGLGQQDNPNPISLIGQLVSDMRPQEKLQAVWSLTIPSGEKQQMQICRIVDHQNKPAIAEGLFYKLIVRLHKYSLGRENFQASVHWQRGLVLDDDYNGMALLEHKGNDVYITVRAPYPNRFLTILTEEVKYLVESFWEGLHCQIMVPCVQPCGKNKAGLGLYEVSKLIASKKQSRPEFPCPACDEWQIIDALLLNSPTAQPPSTELLLTEFTEVKQQLNTVHHEIIDQGTQAMGRFNRLDDRQRRMLSRIDDSYDRLLNLVIDEAKEGPRLFSFEPVDRSRFNPKQWKSAKFRLTLWCEHSRLPLPLINGEGNTQGVYELELTHEWLKKASPYLKFLTSTLSLVLPVASASIKLALDDPTFKGIEEQLEMGKSVVTASIGETTVIGTLMGSRDDVSLKEYGQEVLAEGAVLRQLHVLLKQQDVGYGGLVRVRNKQQKFLWVHPKFEGEY